ncbi:MAG: tetratricopeptide repeat protein [Chloroflexota bacterium]|nr:tetratricopeptide repeat protein [Chloroflexota bacterium]
MRSYSRVLIFSLVVLCIVVILVGCGGPTPTPTNTATPSPQPTPTKEPTPTPSPTPSPIDAVLEGDLLVKQSDFAGAMEAYERAIEIDEEYGQAYAGISYIYYHTELDMFKAVEYAEFAVDKAPDDAYTNATLALSQIQANDISNALGTAQKAVELDLQNVFAHTVLAQAYLANHDYEQSMTAIEAAYELDDDAAEVYHALGEYYEAVADFPRARAAYERAIELEPKFIAWQLALGQFWSNSERFEEAAQIYEEVLEVVPNHAPTLLSLAGTNIEQKNYAGAKEQLEGVEKDSGESAALSSVWGMYYLAQEEYDEALDNFNDGLEIDPEEYGAKIGLANTYLQQEECDQAEDIYLELSNAYPEYAHPVEGRGYAEFCAEDYKKALTHFRDAAEIAPYKDSPHFSMGVTYLYQNRMEDALDELVEAIRLAQAPSASHSYLGDYYYSMGEPELGKIEQRLSLALNPYSVSTYIKLASFLKFEEQYEEALEITQEAVALDPNDEDAQRALGLVYFYQGDADKAVEIFEQLVEDDPEDEISLLHLGLGYRDQKEYREAKKKLETYLSLAGDYLREDQYYKIDNLITNLDEGYIVSEEKALEDLDEFATYYFDRPPQIEIVETEDQGRTMVVTFRSSKRALEEGTFFTDMMVALIITDFYIPRMDPTLDNGLEIKAVEGGKTILSAKSEPSDLKHMYDGLISADELVSKMDISRGDSQRDPAPINQIKNDVEELRELETTQAVPYDTLSQEEVHDHITASIDEQVHESMERDAVLLSLMGVISPGLDIEDVWINLYSEQVAGFYSPEEEMFYLVESDEQNVLDEMVVAHEYVHALQDQNFDLSRMDNPDLNADQTLAFQSLVEGDATLSMILYAEENISDLDRLEAAGEAGRIDQEALEETPLFIRELSLFPYTAGLDFVLALYQGEESWDAVNEAFSDLPQSTEQILHPEKYEDGEAPLMIEPPDVDALSGEQLQEVDRNVFGEFGLRQFLAEHVGPGAAENAAEGWGGDYYLLLKNEENNTYTLLIGTKWDDQEESDEFWSIFRASMAHRAGYKENVEVFFGEPEYRCWHGALDNVCAYQLEDQVTIVIGHDLEDVSGIINNLLNSE